MNVFSASPVPRPKVKALWILVVLAALGCSRTPENVDLPGRILILGVDSLSETKLDELMAAGELPNFSRIVEGGTRATLSCPVPLEIVSLWATAHTGKNPGKHQAVGPFVTLTDGNVIPAPSSIRKGKTLWRILSEHEFLVSIVGVPGTWPAETINGFNFSNATLPTRWTTTQEVTSRPQAGVLSTYPASLLGQVQEHFHNPNEIPREVVSRFFTLTEEEFAAVYDHPIGSVVLHTNPLRDFAVTYSADASYMDIAMHLLDNYQPRVAAVNIELLGAMQPVFWAFSYPELYNTPPDETRRLGGAIDEAYRWVDEQLGRLLERLRPGDTLIVHSVNGFDSVQVNPGERHRSIPTEQATMLLYGQGIRRGHSLTGGSIADLTPTVLALAGVDLAQDMDGNCLTQALTPEFAQAHPRDFRASYDDGWDESDRYPIDFGGTPPADPTSQGN